MAGRVSLRVWIHNEPLRGFRGVGGGIRTWNDFDFKDDGNVRVIPLDRFENAVVPMGALKNRSRSKRRHDS